MSKRQPILAAAIALLLGCGIDLAESNPAPPGVPPSDSASAGGDTSGGSNPAPVAPGDPGTTPTPTPTPTGTPPPSAAAPVTRTVNVANTAYAEATTTIKVGDTVLWKNLDSMDHTTTSDTGLWTGTLRQATGTFSFTFKTAGTFPYHCEFHKSTMKATVVVQP